MDLLVLVVEDRVLDGAVEELVGVAAEELVERVLARDVDGEPAAAAAGAAPLLSQRCHRPRERHADGGVERADVDAELERVGGHDAEQLARDELVLELAPLLRGVAGAVGRDPLGELGVAEVLERVLRELRHQLDRLARLHEHDRARVLRDELGQQVGGLGEHGAARAELLVGDRRVPHRDRALGDGRAVLVDDREVVEAGEALGELAGVADRGARHQEARLGAVGAGDSSQASQDVPDVRAEHAAVDVRLVDDHDREVGEEVPPRGVVGEDPEVQHVGVGEDDVAVAADRGALLSGRVAVVDREPGVLDVERVERARLVLRERLGRVEVERAGASVAAQHVEGRELEAQRLAGGGAGGDDRRAGPAGVDRLGLVRPQRLDASWPWSASATFGWSSSGIAACLPGRGWTLLCVTRRSSSRPACSSSSHGSMSLVTTIRLSA